MSTDNPLTFIASNATIAPALKPATKAAKSKCWIRVERTESKTIQDLLFERYNKPNRQMTNAVKAAIAAAYNKFINDNNWKNVDGVVDNTLSLLSPEDIKLEWDQYCGCSCPCSPGYRVSFNEDLFILSSVKYNADIVVYLRPSLTADEPQPKTAEAAEHEMNIAVFTDTLSRGGRPVKIQITKPFQVIKK